MVLNRVGLRSYVAAGITLLSVFVGSAEQFNNMKTVANGATPAAAMSSASNNAYHAGITVFGCQFLGGF